LGREAHLITGLGLIEEVSPPLKEAEYAIKQTINSIASLLGDAHEHLVESGK